MKTLIRYALIVIMAGTIGLVLSEAARLGTNLHLAATGNVNALEAKMLAMALLSWIGVGAYSALRSLPWDEGSSPSVISLVVWALIGIVAGPINLLLARFKFYPVSQA